MNTEELRKYCLSLPDAVGNKPWTEPQYQMLETFKVGGKWFCLFNPDEKFIDVKCEPDLIASMQSKYKGAFPAWHMNKEHWLGIKLDSDVPDSQIKDLICSGYRLIVDHLSSKKREELGLLR